MKPPKFHWKRAAQQRPLRCSSDYSPAETLRFQNTFSSDARDYRFWWRTFYSGFGVALAFGVGGVFVFEKVEYAFIPMCAVLLFVVLFLFWYPELTCPGCANHLERHFGSYCPQCGLEGLVPADRRDWPHCSKCGDLVRAKSGRTYKIRCCSCCGLSLSSDGV